MSKHTKAFCSRSIFFYILVVLIVILFVDSDKLLRRQLWYKHGMRFTNGKNSADLYYDLARDAVRRDPDDSGFQSYFVRAHSAEFFFENKTDPFDEDYQKDEKPENEP